MRGHIRKRGLNSYAIVIDVGREPETGKRRQKWHTFHGTKRQAQHRLTELLNAVQTGTYVEPSKRSVAEYLSRWLDDYARASVSPRTFEWYEETVRCHLAPALGSRILSELRPIHIQSYVSSALRSGRRPRPTGKKIRPGQPAQEPLEAKGLSARTVLGHFRILHEALRHAVKLELIVRNPADAVEPPRPSHCEMKALDPADVVGFMSASVENPNLNLAILLAAGTGLRRGEILALRWTDVSLDAGVLSVRRSLEETKKGLAFKEPKTAKGRRTVALPAIVVDALRRRRAEQARIRLALGLGRDLEDLVICHPDGRPMRPRSITHAFVNLIRSHKDLPRVRFHDLRHAHATLLLREGVHPKIVSERLGHATIGITLDTYSHVLPGMQADAARKADAALRSALDSKPDQQITA